MQGKHKIKLIAVVIASCLGSAGSVFATEAQNPVTLYVAKKIITMNPMQPEATAVAIKDGKILAVGSLETMKDTMKATPYTLNTDYSNNVITPGMIESHSHFAMLAIFMTHPYVGYWDFPGFNGSTLPAIKSKENVIKALRDADKQMKDPNAILFAWGYDPIYYNNQDLTAADLDSISTTRPIFVLNASEHIGYVNSVLLKRAGYNAQTTTPGVVKGKDGNPNGVLEEMSAAGPVIMSFYKQLFTAESYKNALYSLGNVAQRLGLTTVSELLFGGPGEETMVDIFRTATSDTKFPERLIVVYDGALLAMMENKAKGSGLGHLDQLMLYNSNKLNFGGVKFVSDGSIQGFTARLDWPGYFNGAPNGLFNTTTDELKQAGLLFWKAGHPIHVHANGGEAIQSGLDALQYWENTAPRTPINVVIEHDQVSSAAQMKRAHDLGAYANFLMNHVYYWGDQHYSILLGPTHANVIDDAGEAKRQNLLFSLHTDSPVTPLGPLHTMWAAVNRVTASGRVLGASERLSPEDALKAITINAAYMHNLQEQIGSIEIGKQADLTILKSNPLTVPPMTIKDIPVLATVQSGILYPVSK